MVNEKIGQGPAWIAGITLVGAIFVGVDYMSSREANSKTYMMSGKVVQVVDEVYKKFGSRGRYTTAGEGFSGWVGSQIQKGFNLGNVDTAYIVNPQKFRYMTKGGIFFDPQLVQKDLLESGVKIPVISDVKLDDVIEGTTIEFEPKTDMSFVEKILKGRPKSLSVNSGETNDKYESPVVHPRKLAIVE